ncbi:MAG: hypothetical protein U0Y96_06935 [Candidatus Kapaibacterium sp.]|nr:hypothetical protein [Bacteroidota bacterium]
MSYTQSQKDVINFINRNPNGITIHDYLYYRASSIEPEVVKLPLYSKPKLLKVQLRGKAGTYLLSFSNEDRSTMHQIISDYFLISRDLNNKGLITVTMDDTSKFIELLKVPQSHSIDSPTLQTTEQLATELFFPSNLSPDKLNELIEMHSDILFKIGFSGVNATRKNELLFPLPGLSTYINNNYQTDSEVQAKQLIIYSRNNLLIAIGAVLVSAGVSLYTTYKNSDIRKVIYTEFQDTLLVKQVPLPKDTSKTTVKIDSAKKVSP